jgi:hypothetical protein
MRRPDQYGRPAIFNSRQNPRFPPCHLFTVGYGPADAPPIPKNFRCSQVLICGATIVTLSMGIRHGFGLWLQPITQAQGWTRETFAFALAIQNLAWGVLRHLRRHGGRPLRRLPRAAGGAVLYALGLVGMALSPTGFVFTLTAGMLIGAAQAGTTYAVVYGSSAARSTADQAFLGDGRGGRGRLLRPVPDGAGRRLPDQRARLARGAAGAGRRGAADRAAGAGPARAGLRGGQPAKREQTIGQALREAFKYPSFQLLMAGYFVCGFQVVFIGVHMPSYLKDKGLSPQVASYALALIGLFNVFGTYIAGTLGQKLAKRKILATIYLSRAVAIAVFLWAPLSAAEVYIFAA